MILFRRAKHRLMAWNDRELRALVAEEIAKEILATVAGPGACCEDPYCPDRIRYRQSQADAAVARRIGALAGERAAGRAAGQ